MLESSPYAQPIPGLRIKEGAPPIARPSKEEMERYPAEAQQLLERTWSAQQPLLAAGRYNLKWLEGAHFVLAGATGPGLGGALAAAILNQLGDRGSLTIIARDLKKSVGFETGLAMKNKAEAMGFGQRFQWSNSGLAIEGNELAEIIAAIKATGADRVIYFNTVAAANSGLLPGMPPVYVKDMDEDGILQWQLTPLTDKNIEATKFIMGAMSVQFGDALEKAGFKVQAACFADWRGSLDRDSRNPASKDYGKWGAYSTSLFLPKDIVHDATTAAYGTDKKLIDFYFPIMRTRALDFIPGGRALSYVYDKLMEMENIRRIDVPEVALMALDRLGYMLESRDFNPFPRLDAHELPVDLWFFEVMRHLNEKEDSPFYFKNWMKR